MLLTCAFALYRRREGTAQARRQEPAPRQAVKARTAPTADNGRRQSVTAGHLSLANVMGPPRCQEDGTTWRCW